MARLTGERVETAHSPSKTSLTTNAQEITCPLMKPPRTCCCNYPDAVGAACLRLLLVGHSLGGSIAVRMAGAAEEFKRRCGGAAEIAGVVTVDVVEGTALAALDDMPKVGCERREALLLAQ